MKTDEFTKWTMTIFCSVVSFLILALLINRFYNPDISSCFEWVKNCTILNPKDILPEPKEKLLYITGYVSLPILLLFFYWLFTKFRIVVSSTLVVYSIILVQLVAISSSVIFSVNSVQSSIKYLFHFNSVFFPINQVVAGFPLLIDGFRNFYGLNAQMLGWLFNIIGLSVLKFTVVMAILLFLSYGFLFLTLRMMVKNKWLLLVGFTAMTYFTITILFFRMGDNYFQYSPIRIIFPSMILYLATVYLLKNKNWLYYPILALCSAGILWNLEMGLAITIGWLAALLYKETFSGKCIVNVTKHISKLILMFGIVFVVYNILVYHESFFIDGKLPDYSLCLTTISLFGAKGFYLLPMPVLHLWNLVVLVYLVGLLYAISTLFDKKYSSRSAVVLMITVLGMTTFGYYQGRSHDNCLFASWKEAFMLLPIFADDCWKRFKWLKINSPLLPYYGIILFIITAIMCLGFAGFVVTVPKYFNHITTKGSNVVFMSNLNFIKKHATKGEGILVVSGNQGVLLNESGTHSVFRSDLYEIMLNEDFKAFTDLIDSDEDFKIFFDPRGCADASQYLTVMNYVSSRTTEGKLIVVDSIPGMVLLRKNKQRF